VTRERCKGVKRAAREGAAFSFCSEVFWDPEFLGSEPSHLASRFLFHGHRARTAWGTLDAIAELTNVYLQLGDSTAESIAVHAQFARSAALVAPVFLKHGEYESLLELTYAFGIKNVALVHLQDECFQLIFHDASLFSV